MLKRNIKGKLRKLRLLSKNLYFKRNGDPVDKNLRRRLYRDRNHHLSKLRYGQLGLASLAYGLSNKIEFKCYNKLENVTFSLWMSRMDPSEAIVTAAKPSMRPNPSLYVKKCQSVKYQSVLSHSLLLIISISPHFLFIFTFHFILPKPTWGWYKSPAPLACELDSRGRAEDTSMCAICRGVSEKADASNISDTTPAGIWSRSAKSENLIFF